MPKRRSGAVKMMPKMRTLDSRTVKPQAKKADPELQSRRHQQWASEVMRMAGRRCEALEKGGRCQNRWPEHQMYADHRVERRDGEEDPNYDPYDVRNGQCLCAKHHTEKTVRERQRRLAEQRSA